MGRLKQRRTQQVRRIAVGCGFFPCRGQGRSALRGRVGEDAAAVHHLHVDGLPLPRLVEKDDPADAGVEDHPPAHEAGHPAPGPVLLEAVDVEGGVVHEVEARPDDRVGLRVDGMADLVMLAAGDLQALTDAFAPLQAAADAGGRASG